MITKIAPCLSCIKGVVFLTCALTTSSALSLSMSLPHPPNNPTSMKDCNAYDQQMRTISIEIAQESLSRPMHYFEQHKVCGNSHYSMEHRSHLDLIEARCKFKDEWERGRQQCRQQARAYENTNRERQNRPDISERNTLIKSSASAGASAYAKRAVKQTASIAARNSEATINIAGKKLYKASSFFTQARRIKSAMDILTAVGNVGTTDWVQESPDLATKGASIAQRRVAGGALSAIMLEVTNAMIMELHQQLWSEFNKGAEQFYADNDLPTPKVPDYQLLHIRPLEQEYALTQIKSEMDWLESEVGSNTSGRQLTWAEEANKLERDVGAWERKYEQEQKRIQIAEERRRAEKRRVQAEMARQQAEQERQRLLAERARQERENQRLAQARATQRRSYQTYEPSRSTSSSSGWVGFATELLKGYAGSQVNRRDNSSANGGNSPDSSNSGPIENIDYNVFVDPYSGSSGNSTKGPSVHNEMDVESGKGCCR